MASCGSCNLCCTIMGVQMEPLEQGMKEPYVTCSHLCPGKKGSCGVYANRPTTCRTWECVWLSSQHLTPTMRLPAFLRPDRTGVVLEGTAEGTLVAHCATGDEWMKKPIYGYLMEMTKRGIVLVGHHEEYQQLKPDGSLEDLVRIGVSEKGAVMYIYKKDLAA